MARIFIDDGFRRYEQTGYGQLARMVIRALHEHSRYEVCVAHDRSRSVPHGASRPETFAHLPSCEEGWDATLRIGSPAPLKTSGKPFLYYTQNALGGLRSEWAQWLAQADTLIVPGEFDRSVFERHHDHVHVCPQAIDAEFFVPVPSYRSEGAEETSYLFVGSFGYRKGTDLILPAFARAFADGAPVHVHLQCFSGLNGRAFTDLFARARNFPRNIRVSFGSDSLSLLWMRRHLNRHDAVFTLSRGEGWCMPLWEALHSGLPTVAPASTAMAEYLPRWGTEFIETREVEIASIPDPAAASLVRQYGEDGITLYEPDLNDAARALRQIYESMAERKQRVRARRGELVSAFGLDRMAEALSGAIDATLARCRATSRG
ncbi:glycosyltransferase family 4 protein [Rhodosalinus sp. 5P4]|uniref:glycosyltransferase family 4 protein n=1 Tax=Rhodosalinus sp. 5P4 TaxID=3239196 RepID=UPI003523405D